MKHVKLFFGAFLCLTMMMACSDTKIISVVELPANAQTYLKENYPDREVEYVKKESEFLSTKYEVMLDGGLQIEFNGDGEPVDVDIED